MTKDRRGLLVYGIYVVTWSTDRRWCVERILGDNRKWEMPKVGGILGSVSGSAVRIPNPSELDKPVKSRCHPAQLLYNTRSQKVRGSGQLAV